MLLGWRCLRDLSDFDARGGDEVVEYRQQLLLVLDQLSEMLGNVAGAPPSPLPGRPGQHEPVRDLLLVGDLVILSECLQVVGRDVVRAVFDADELRQRPDEPLRGLTPQGDGREESFL